MVATSLEHIEIVQGAGGPKPRIAGSCIRVQDVVLWHEREGMSVEEIVEQYPTITRADIYAALAYYWDHKQELDARIADDEAFVEEYFRDHNDPVEARIQAQQRDDAPSSA